MEGSIYQTSTELLYMDAHGGMPSLAFKKLKAVLELNIAEATDVDRELGVKMNADIGMTVAAAVEKEPAPYMNEHGNFVWPFQKEFLDACTPACNQTRPATSPPPCRMLLNAH